MAANRIETAVLRTVGGISKINGDQMIRMTADTISKCKHMLLDCSSKSTNQLVNILDNVSNELCCIGDVAELIRTVSSDTNNRRKADTCVKSIHHFMDLVNSNLKLYEILTSTKLSDCKSEEERKVLDNMIESMKVHGVHLKDDKKQKYLMLLQQDAFLSYSLTKIKDEILLENNITYKSIPIKRCELEAIGINIQESNEYFTEKIGSWGLDENDWINIIAGTSLFNKVLERLPDEKKRKEMYLIREEINNSVGSCLLPLNDDLRTSKECLLSLLNIRQQIAKYSGFSSWLYLAQRGVIKSPKDVYSFLMSTFERIKPNLYNELSILYNIKIEDCYKGEKYAITREIQPWDLNYLKYKYSMQILREIKCDKENTSLFFQLLNPSLMLLLDYMNWILINFFNVQLNLVKLHNFGNIWDDKVLMFTISKCNLPTNQEFHKWEKYSFLTSNISNSTNALNSSSILGELYLDLWERKDKPDIFAQFTLRGSKHLDSNEFISKIGNFSTSNQIPAVCLVSNFPFPSSNLTGSNIEWLASTKISLISSIPFFHEFGHAIHSLLSKTNYQHLSGTRGPTDYVEFHSHFMENFVRSPKYFIEYLNVTCKSFKKVSNNKYLEKFVNQLPNLELIELIRTALIDQHFYSFFLEGLNINKTQYYHKITSSICDLISKELYINCGNIGSLFNIIRVPPLITLDHLIHYGGTYYCYPYCKVLSSNIWSQTFERNDLYNKYTLGSNYREHILSKGSVDPSLKPITKFLDSLGIREIKIDASKPHILG
ncbi:putative peptidase family M3 [Cryptosporidium serpentis]